MDSNELQQLAQLTRSKRETGFALIVASLILGALLLIPIGAKRTVPAPVAEEPSLPNAFTKVDIKAKSAIVYDLKTGETLYAKNADAQLPLASLTKLLTVYAALTELSSQTPITIPPEVALLEAPHAFNVGQVLSLSDLARLTLTASLNDGAAAIASAVATRKNISESEMLAGAAAALELSQTYAVNGSGLDINTAISGGYGSARDLARLAGSLAEKFPKIAEATTYSFAEATSVGGTTFKVKNTDPVIGSLPRLLLSKTGYTDLAGGNLALVFDAGLLHPVAVIVLGSSKNDRFVDGSTLVKATQSYFSEETSK